MALRSALAASAVLSLALPAAAEPDDSTFEDHQAGSGARIAGGSWGVIHSSIYFSIRYLNQRLIDDEHTDADGNTTALDRRDDLQFQKVILYLKGWVGVPELRYLTYVWSSNASQGLGAQVVVAGNLQYKVADELVLGAGIGSLPTTHSTRNTFPFWLSVDSRAIADEYFRGSYTSGIWAQGEVGPFRYIAMVGNNLSQLGIDAGQLDAGMQTYSAALGWSAGGLDPHEGVFETGGLAGGVGLAFTQSREDAQSQPGVDAPDNAQLRISDGRLLFADGVFGAGTKIDRATYRMAALYGAIEGRGLALEGEVYYRRLGSFEATGPLAIDSLHDKGFQVQASAMLVPRTWMAYAFGSKIFGEYGDPWQLAGGANWFPFHNRGMRLNAEAIYVRHSPVGNLSSPLLVGANGPIVVLNFELFF